MSATISPTPSTPPAKPSKARRIGRFLLRFLLVVIVLLLVATGIGYFLIWQPSFQQKMLQQFTNKMSEEWNVVFKIDSMAMNDLGHYQFYNFYLEDPDQDTLIFAELVEAKHVDIWKIWKEKRISIGHAMVSNAVFKVQRTARKRYFSLDFILDYFHADDPLPIEERFKFSIDTALVNQVRYIYSDASEGISITAVIKKVYAAGHDVDLIRKRALLDSMYINQPTVYIEFKNPIAIPDSVPPSPYSTLPDGEVPLWHVSSYHIDVQDMVYRSTESSKQLANQKTVPQNKTGKGNAGAAQQKEGIFSQKAKTDEKKQFAASNNRENKDLTNLHVTSLTLSIDSFELHEGNYKGHIKRFSAAMTNGFRVKSFRADFAVGPKRAVLRNFRLRTKDSSFGNAVVLDYESFESLKNFMEEVYVSFNLSDCQFSFAEVGVFVPSLLDNVLIKMNENTIINISGEYQGLMKHFDLTDIDVQLGKGIKMDKAQAAKKTPVEWLIKTFGPKNKERQAREQAARKAEHQKELEKKREQRGQDQKKPLFKKKEQ